MASEALSHGAETTTQSRSTGTSGGVRASPGWKSVVSPAVTTKPLLSTRGRSGWITACRSPDRADREPGIDVLAGCRPR